jgi:hypothetical protein
VKGLSKSLFLAINAKGGESIKPKAKGPHHHLILKLCFEFVCYISNWHPSDIVLNFNWDDYFQLVFSKIDFQKLGKTLLKTKRRILFRGNFV